MPLTFISSAIPNPAFHPASALVSRGTKNSIGSVGFSSCHTIDSIVVDPLRIALLELCHPSGLDLVVLHLAHDPLALVRAFAGIRRVAHDDHDGDVALHLVRGLLLRAERIRPYYVFQCDPVAGLVERFGVPLARAREIESFCAERIGGLALPRFVADLPGSRRKTPIDLL